MTQLLHLHVLASGSKGNAAIVEGPDGCLLIDCGISCRQVMLRSSASGVDPASIRAAVLTHEHIDHVRGVRVFAKRFEGTFLATRGTTRGCADLSNLPVSEVAHEDRFEVAGLSVRTFPTSHDVNDPFGLRVSAVDEQGKELDAIGWCTDTGLLGEAAMDCLRGCRILGIETNHDTQMLQDGPYPYYLKRRVGGDVGHLSNVQAAEALEHLVTAQTEVVVGLHISQNNNTPARAKQALVDALEPLEASPSVLIANQDEPLTVW